jgi:hypothetical protein
MGLEPKARVSGHATEENRIVLTMVVENRHYRVWGHVTKDMVEPGAVKLVCFGDGGAARHAIQTAATQEAQRWAQSHPEELARLFADAKGWTPKA